MLNEKLSIVKRLGQCPHREGCVLRYRSRDPSVLGGNKEGVTVRLSERWDSGLRRWSPEHVSLCPGRFQPWFILHLACGRTL